MQNLIEKIANLKVVLLFLDLFIKVALSPCSDESCFRLLWAIPA